MSILSVYYDGDDKLTGKKSVDLKIFSSENFVCDVANKLFRQSTNKIYYIPIRNILLEVVSIIISNIYMNEYNKQ